LLIVTLSASVRLRETSNHRPRNDHRIATLVVLNDLGDDPEANPIIIRRTSGIDAIVVSRETRSAQLAAAALQLSRIRSASGDAAASNVVYRIRTGQEGRSEKPSSDLRVAGRIMSNLRTAPILNIPGVGRARAVEVYLPDATLRDVLERK